MAVTAHIYQQREYVALDLYTDEKRFRATDDPYLSGYTLNPWIEFYFDDEKLDRGEREFLGVELGNIARLTEDDLKAIEQLNRPRIDIPEANLFNVAVTDVLRRIQHAWTEQRELVTA